MMANRELDLIIFGATGFTGQYAVRNLVKCMSKNNLNYKFGIAGRNKEKLHKVLDWALNQLTEEEKKLARNVPIVIADVKDEGSLKEMVERCRIVINLVGPYILYGEPVVKACVEAGTHHIDISGEPQFLEGVQVKFDEKAKQSGSYVVGSCGFDSMPADCGVQYMEDKFSDIVFNQVEGYIKPKVSIGQPINHGTFDSLVASIENYKQLKPIRTELFSKLSTKGRYQYDYPLKKHFFPIQSPAFNKYCVPLWPTDKSVVRRTQYQKLTNDEKHVPVQFEQYIAIPHYIFFILMMIFAPVFLILVQFEKSRKWLKDNPALFTFGMFSKDGPTHEQVASSSFNMFMVGKGWLKSKLPENGGKPSEPPMITRTLQITGPEIAYDATSIMACTAALTVLSDLGNGKGGVVTPALAFKGTKLIDRLNQTGVQFNIYG